MNSIFALQNQVCCTRDVSFLNSFESVLINKIVWKLMLFWKKIQIFSIPHLCFFLKRNERSVVNMTGLDNWAGYTNRPN